MKQISLKRFKKILIKFFIDLLLYLSFKLVKILLNFIGFNNTSLLGGYLFKKIGPVTKYHQIIKSNMKVIYKDEEKIKSFAIRNLEQTGKTFFEFINLNKFNKNKLTVINDEYLKEIINKKKSYLFVSAHYGNWEITRNFLLDYGFKLHSVYRQANNKLINNEIQKIRKKPGAYFYKKGKESAKHMIKALKNNECLAILVDQKDNSGSKINFFNNPANTNTGFAALALKYQTTICPIRSKRITNDNFEIIIDKPILYNEFKNKTEVELTQQIYSEHIEKWIIEDPSQWLWAHKRW